MDTAPQVRHEITSATERSPEKFGSCILSLTTQERDEQFPSDTGTGRYQHVRCPIGSCMTYADINSAPPAPLPQGIDGWDDCELDRLSLR